MKTGSKDKGDAPINKQQHNPAIENDLSVGDQLLARLFKIRVPIVPDSDPPTSPAKSRTPHMQFDTGDVYERLMKRYPGLTREKIDEMAKDLGF